MWRVFKLGNIIQLCADCRAAVSVLLFRCGSSICDERVTVSVVYRVSLVPSITAADDMI